MTTFIVSAIINENTPPTTINSQDLVYINDIDLLTPETISYTEKNGSYKLHTYYIPITKCYYEKLKQQYPLKLASMYSDKDNNLVITRLDFQFGRVPRYTQVKIEPGTIQLFDQTNGLNIITDNMAEITFSDSCNINDIDKCIGFYNWRYYRQGVLYYNQESLMYFVMSPCSVQNSRTSASNDTINPFNMLFTNQFGIMNQTQQPSIPNTCTNRLLCNSSYFFNLIILKKILCSIADLETNIWNSA